MVVHQNAIADDIETDGVSSTSADGFRQNTILVAGQASGLSSQYQ